MVIEASIVRAGGAAGSGEVVVTGVGAEVLREHVLHAVGWVRSYCDQIADVLKVPPFRSFLRQHMVRRAVAGRHGPSIDRPHRLTASSCSSF